MATVYKMKFKSIAPYSFTKSCGKNKFNFHICYSVSDDTYYMDIDMWINGKYEPIAHCIRMSCGTDLFIPYKRFGLGTLFIIPTDSRNVFDNNGPTSKTILDRYIIYWEHE